MIDLYKMQSRSDWAGTQKESGCGSQNSTIEQSLSSLQKDSS